MWLSWGFDNKVRIIEVHITDENSRESKNSACVCAYACNYATFASLQLWNFTTLELCYFATWKGEIFFDLSLRDLINHVFRHCFKEVSIEIYLERVGRSLQCV